LGAIGLIWLHGITANAVDVFIIEYHVDVEALHVFSRFYMIDLCIDPV
jgi:hypothetical protein